MFFCNEKIFVKIFYILDYCKDIQNELFEFKRIYFKQKIKCFEYGFIKVYFFENKRNVVMDYNFCLGKFSKRSFYLIL